MNDKDLKDLKDSIKVPKALDKTVAKALEKGRKTNRLKKRNKVLRKCAIVAGLTIGTTLGAVVINPDLVNAIPSAKKVFEGFNTTLFGEPTKKFEEAAKVIGQSKTNKSGTITLDEAIFDDNILMLGVTVESNFLKGYEGKNEGDFFYLEPMIYIDGKEINSIGTSVRKISDNKGAIVIECNIAELNIGENANIEVKIPSIERGFKNIKGKWNFNFNLNKEASKRIKLDKKIHIKDSQLIVDELVISKLSNTLLLKGKDNFNDSVINKEQFIVKDNNNKYFRAKLFDGNWQNSGEFHGKLQIKGDLSNSEYIELLTMENQTIIEDINGFKYAILKTTGEENGQYEKEIISRKPTKEELKDGYGLDNVTYCLNIDKKKEFKPLKELIGSKIKVNSTEVITIKDIILNENSTKVIFQSKGMYDYKNLSKMIILDENMNDLARREGQKSAAIEDEEKGLYSMTLDKVDENKKYKIAIPIINDIDISKPKWSMVINLK
ncbi:DUF4179 domain-containing protein [Clostridium tarantellae]|uniref:DUF4179 domain-containing protein n=1 Tax=Clostridium tarantellae TaxID=39493 RepID=A0A6I1MME4_9CLOT|nr:DUF4179 domain-containing protein [Clostridium tarantellae]MPQ44555.1 DUF4179 domain-containing protein [Clostridium tarantellae]